VGYDTATAERLRVLFAGRTDVAEKRMVGGLSFVVNGNMCCGVNGSALMVRVGPDDREQALSEPHVRPLELGGRPVRGFVLIDPDGFATDAALAAWVRRGLDFVGTLPAKR
jgi:TfoX/Sxy family transcriptional regulator of competence genes